MRCICDSVTVFSLLASVPWCEHTKIYSVVNGPGLFINLGHHKWCYEEHFGTLCLLMTYMDTFLLSVYPSGSGSSGHVQLEHILLAFQPVHYELANDLRGITDWTVSPLAPFKFICGSPKFPCNCLEIEPLGWQLMLNKVTRALIWQDGHSFKEWKRHQGSLVLLAHTRGHSGKVTVCSQERTESSPETQPVSTLILDLSLQNCEKINV